MRNLLHRTAATLFALVIGVSVRPDETKGSGFVPMFNGRDLAGWVNVNCAPGTFFVKGDEIITTGKPTGYLRTAKQYENFIAEFEWMHINKKEVGNSGFFVWADPLPGVGTPYTRGIEVQVLVNLEKEGYYTSQGDLFSIHGATCKPDRPHPHGWARCLPSENRCKGGGEWNHYKVIGKDGVLKLHVNGKEVSGLSECQPRKGYLALESEGAECHFRNLKIEELPSSNPKPEETAELATGFRNLFTGLDLSGWKGTATATKHWQPRDWVLHYDGKGEPLRTEKEFTDAEYLVDFRSSTKKNENTGCYFRLRDGLRNGKGEVTMYLTQSGFVVLGPGLDRKGDLPDLKPAGQWNRLHLSLAGGMFQARINGKKFFVDASIGGTPGPGAFFLMPEGEMDFGNLFVRELKK